MNQATQVALPLVLALIAAASGGLVTWLVARRRTSGTIATSEAETLWDEGKQMRKELRDEVLVLRADLSKLQVEAADLRRELASLHVEAEELRDKNRELLSENDLLRGQLGGM